MTAELYASGQELERLNLELSATNEELQALNQAMKDFVAVASHDLRGPLTAILGLSSILAKRWDKVPADRRRESLSIIERQAQHLARMVEDLLTVSRIEAGALDTKREVIRVREAVDRIVEDFGTRVEEIRVADDLEVLADPHHLQRILFNYVGNALKHGAPPVMLEARCAGEWIEIRVRDHGDGVPDDFVPRLFGKFSRAEGSREADGTGLGLSIVQGLARANGGETWYERNEPRGSCFAVRLPKAAA